MALARKTLVAQNSVIGPMMIQDPWDRNGAATIQYFSGTGTVILEATNDDALKADNATANASAVWVQLANCIDATGAAATQITAAGAIRCEVVGFKFLRARKTDAGGANTDCALDWRLN